MVTHIPPPSPSFSSASLSYQAQSSSSSVSPYAHPHRPEDGYPYHSRQSSQGSRSAYGGSRSAATQPTRLTSYAPSAYTQANSRAPSVSSRASTSAARDRERGSSRRHHHRSSRTSAGSLLDTQSNSSVKNEFPWFSQSGDVEIVIRDRSGKRKELRYKLHGLILAQSSEFFKEQLGQDLGDHTDPFSNRAAAGNGVELSRGRALRRSREDSAGSRASSILSHGSRQRTGDIGNSCRWRYELDWGEPNVEGEDSLPILVQSSTTPPSFRHRTKEERHPPSAANSSIFRNLASHFSRGRNSRHSDRSRSSSRDSGLGLSSNASHTLDDDLLQAYENLFLAFYNHAPILDQENIANAYVQSKTLLLVAQLYAALPCVQPRVDHHLLSFHSKLWLQIAKYPSSYLKLGHLARSRAIFGEAFIHVVGQWPAASGQLIHQQSNAIAPLEGNAMTMTLDNAVLDLVEDKFEDLEELKARIDVKLFRLSLTTSRGDRVTPQNSWLDWLVVSFFRQWFAERSNPGSTGTSKERSAISHRTPSRNGRFRKQDNPSSSSHSSASSQSINQVYKLVAQGGSAYLPADELKRFLKSTPAEAYNRENLRRLERRMDELKTMAKDIVRPLTRNFLRVEGGDLPYLTCTRLDEKDLHFVWGT
ncbi:MAG: hypothetical protein M1831_003809 [Alyxoria varia]|nr:MAG: hypothetical protein M1831_003809 [Alyxoria varia]